MKKKTISEIVDASISYLKVLDKEYMDGELSVPDSEYQSTISHVSIMCHDHPYMEERKALLRSPSL